MKKLIALSFFIMAGFGVFSQNSVMKSNWSKSLIVADGSLSDWKQLPAMYDSDSKIFYDIANDSSNLYLCFKVNDLKTQMRIIRSGMNIELIYKGKPKRKAYIFYPLKEDFDNSESMKSDLSMLKTTDFTTFMDVFKLKQTNMQLKGFCIDDGLYPLKNVNGINAAIDWDDNNSMYYEVVIPFKDFMGNKYNMKDLQKILTLKVELNATEQSNLNRKPQGMEPSSGGFRPNGGDMMAGGMQPPSGMRPGGGRMPQEGLMQEGNQNTKTQFSQKFKLSI